MSEHKELRDDVEATVAESPICKDLSTGEEGCHSEYCEKYNDDCITCVADRVLTRVAEAVGRMTAPKHTEIADLIRAAQAGGLTSLVIMEKIAASERARVAALLRGEKEGQ